MPSSRRSARSGYDVAEGADAPGQDRHRARRRRRPISSSAKGYDIAPIGVENTKTDAADRRGHPVRRGPDLRLRRLPPWGPQAAPVPGTCSGAVDAAGKPINLQTWYEAQRGRESGQSSRSVVYGKSVLRPGPRGVQGQPNAARPLTAPSPSSGTTRRSTRASGSRPRSSRRLFGYVLAHATDTATDIPAMLTKTRAVVRAGRQPRRLRLHVPDTSTRLWRKNLPDNDGNGKITGDDGVDPNRNWADKWRYDQEGASDDLDSETYRGRRRQSEPEVSSLDALIAGEAEVPDRLPLVRGR